MNIWAIVPLVSFLTFTALVALVLQQTRRRVDKVFALFLSASALWSLSSFLLVYNTSSSHLLFWNSMVIVTIPWAVVSYYHFVRVYNNKPGGIFLYIGYGRDTGQIEFDQRLPNGKREINKVAFEYTFYSIGLAIGFDPTNNLISPIFAVYTKIPQSRNDYGGTVTGIGAGLYF